MTDEPLDVRARIVRAASELLADGGREAVSTRAVGAAAGVQAPTIYRQFGDMQGLLNAVAGDALTQYLLSKRVAQQSEDPLDDLRRGWEHHVAFGLANPGAYLLIYSDPISLAETPAKREAEAILLALVARIAEAGTLGVEVAHAARMITAACRGVTLSLIATPPGERDERLSRDIREAVIDAITVSSVADRPSNEGLRPSRVAARAVALRAVLPESPGVLSAAELRMLGEWLDRLSIRND